MNGHKPECIFRPDQQPFPVCRHCGRGLEWIEADSYTATKRVGYWRHDGQAQKPVRSIMRGSMGNWTEWLFVQQMGQWFAVRRSDLEGSQS